MMRGVRTAARGLAAKIARDLAAYPPELVALGRKREQYLKEIDRQQPIPITRTTLDPLIRLVSERVNDDDPPVAGSVIHRYTCC